MCADKPNHHLQYEIGTDFCLEDPSKISTLLRIDCPLKREPLPKPIYEWTIVLNQETEVNPEASNLQSLGVHMFGEDNRSINLNATIALRNYMTIIVRCTVENLFGNDTETTTIDVCSMLDIICIIKIIFKLSTWQVQVSVKMVSQTTVLRSAQEKMERTSVAAILVLL